MAITAMPASRLLATGGESEGIRDHHNLPDGGLRFFDVTAISAVASLLDGSVAAVILEPMEYETFAPAPPGYLAGLLELCRAAIRN